MTVHHIAHDLRRPAEGDLMQHDPRRPKHPVLSVHALDPHTVRRENAPPERFPILLTIAGDSRGAAQPGQHRRLLLSERRAGAAEHVSERPLADRQAEHIREHRLQALIRDMLHMLQIERQSLNVRPERRPRGERRRFRPYSASRAGAGQASMAGDDRPDRRQIHIVASPDHLAGRIRRKRMAAGHAALRTVLDHLVGLSRQHPEVALVARPGASRLRGGAPFLAIGRRRFGRRPRRLRRPLQLQNKLNQLVLAQVLKFIAIHSKGESRWRSRGKGVGNYEADVDKRVRVELMGHVYNRPAYGRGGSLELKARAVALIALYMAR